MVRGAEIENVKIYISISSLIMKIYGKKAICPLHRNKTFKLLYM